MAFQLHVLMFLFAFVLGLLACYLVAPPMTVTHRFPSPFNADTTIYRGRFGECYKYRADKVDCKGGFPTRRQPVVPN